MLKLFMVSLLFFSAWCVGQEALPVKVVDDKGRAVQLARPASRIISLAPHITELLFESGAGKQVVGVVSYSDYPAEAKAITNIGSYVDINVEAVVNMRPDLIVAYGQGNPSRQLSQLQAFGIPVYFSDPETIPDIISNIRKLGRLTGHQQQADLHADQLKERYARLLKNYAHVEPVSLFVQIWHDPLMTVSNNHLIGKVAKICGATNLFSESLVKFPKVSLESVISLKPQSVLLMGAHGAQGAEIAQPKGSWLSVIDTKQIVIEENLLYRASGRLLDGTEQLCEKLDVIRQSSAKKNAKEHGRMAKTMSVK